MELFADPCAAHRDKIACTPLPDNRGDSALLSTLVSSCILNLAVLSGALPLLCS